MISHRDLLDHVGAATSPLTHPNPAGESCAEVNAPLIARIGWCHRQAMEASTTLEIEQWYAEQKGLIDALLDRDCTHEYQDTASVRARYSRGLQDGRVLVQVAKDKARLPTYIHSRTATMLIGGQ